MKFCGVWLILLLCIVNLKLAGCFKCDFVNWWGDYTCQIEEDSIVSEEKHLDKKNDDDVKIYKFEGKNNKKHFTQQELTLICQKFENLEEFAVSHIRSVDDNLFEECKNLKGIRIEDSELEKISENLFLYQSGLLGIYLSNNKLRTLPENVFSNQRELVYLDLYKNLISCLPPNIFKSLTELFSLHLDGNQIQSLNPKWFETLQSLKRLGLSHNKIQDLPKNVFVHLKNLEFLNLDGNQLTTIHSDSFGILRNLKYIYLGNNTINSIDAKFFDNTGIQKIDMSGNVCSKEYIRWSNKIKEELSNCTSRYQPRVESTVSIIVNNCECGTRVRAKGMIFGGNATGHGDYPWNVALVTNENQLFCGGSLVSNKHVLTAAHCMKGKHGANEFGISDFSVLLGVNNYSNQQEEGRVLSSVNSINIHQHWNTNVQIYDGDIAVLELTNEIQFSNLIRPICLADEDHEIAQATNGTVVGFGRTEKGSLSDVAKKLRIPIRNYQDCTANRSDHRYYASARTFCGGPANGTGVCDGDGGGGVYVKYNQKYYLRGLVSASLINDNNQCDVYKEAIFTDVLQYYDWIKRGGKQKANVGP